MRQSPQAQARTRPSASELNLVLQASCCGSRGDDWRIAEPSDIAAAARLPRPAGADRRRQRLPRRRRAQHRRRRPALQPRGALLHADGLRRRRPRPSARRSSGASRRRSPSRFEMEHRFAESSERKRVAIMVSREDHCLSDLLWRWRSGELGAELVARHLQPPRPRRAGRLARPPLPPRPGRRRRPRRRPRRGRWSCSARSTCSSSPATCRSSPASFLERLGAPAINIHHSFLPAFVGADPYRRAHERGVKLIGATAHYVTEELDAGPIIDQDVTRVSHRDEVERPDADRPRHRAPRPRPRRQGPPRRPGPARRRRGRSSSERSVT